MRHFLRDPLDDIIVITFTRNSRGRATHIDASREADGSADQYVRGSVSVAADAEESGAGCQREWLQVGRLV